MRSALRRLVTLTGLSTAGPEGDDITLRRQRMVRHNEPNEVQSLMLWASTTLARSASLSNTTYVSSSCRITQRGITRRAFEPYERLFGSLYSDRVDWFRTDRLLVIKYPQ